MQGKIALEDHFAIEPTLGDSQVFGAHVWSELGPRLLDFQDKRLGEMDSRHRDHDRVAQCPGDPGDPRCQDGDRGGEQANDVLAGEVRKRPDRFAGVAALPMQDPDSAAAELAALRQGARFQGRAGQRLLASRDRPTPSLYYDLPQYRPFWRVVERARRSVLSASAQSAAGLRSAVYEGHDWLLGPNWAFAAETAVHALRLIGSGLFDECPRLQIILGHLGEGLPYYLWRIDNRNAWMKAAHKYAARKPVARLFPRQFPPHDVRPFQHARADRRRGGDGRRPRHVLGRLAVRGHERRRATGSTRPQIGEADRHKIGRDQCDQAVQADGSVSQTHRRAARDPTICAATPCALPRR